MALLDVRIPQMGEGLQEVVIVGFHKKPGDAVKRDELLYSMETDKAVMDVESPYDGVVKEWLATEGAVLPINAPIARLQTSFTAAEPAAADVVKTTEITDPKNSTPPPGARDRSSQRIDVGIVIPPRTRAMCKQLGITDDEMRTIPSAGGKLMPADVNTYIAARGSAPTTPNEAISHSQNLEHGAHSPDYTFTEMPLSPQQRVFTSRIRRSAALVIPATMTMPVMWEPVCKCTHTHREQDFTFRPTEFQTFAWCVAQASKDHPKLRSTLQGDETVREYTHLNLGVAVGLKSGELATAVVHAADSLDFHEFVNEIQAAITLAREGKDQADAATQVHLTYMGPYGITEATPLLVAPAIAVLFVGAPYPREGNRWVNLSLTIDHRLINGVEGAKFLKTIVETIQTLDELT